ncbi:MAG: hypothetical protein LBV45_00285 [Xanthomonadaceae bacterium]|nr:hypothetical protein [Xanthomonadaceae bacterium]
MLIAFAACSTNTVPVVETASAPASTTPPELILTCQTDADCTVKNVGNCCGYYPACVNQNSPANPEAVTAQCQARGMMGVCGFPEITGCQCVSGQCRASETDLGPGRPIPHDPVF